VNSLILDLTQRTMDALRKILVQHNATASR
jgi:hypothetical protein